MAMIQQGKYIVGLNPCFGGFGWERSRIFRGLLRGGDVLILVLVDLGGKELRKSSYKQ